MKQRFTVLFAAAVAVAALAACGKGEAASAPTSAPATTVTTEGPYADMQERLCDAYKVTFRKWQDNIATGADIRAEMMPWYDKLTAMSESERAHEIVQEHYLKVKYLLTATRSTGADILYATEELADECGINFEHKYIP